MNEILPSAGPFGAWAGSRTPKMLIVGEAWGKDEEACRTPFVGYSGKELFRMIGEAMPDLHPELYTEALRAQRYDNAWLRPRNSWLQAAEIAYTNTLNLRPPSNNLDFLCCSRKDLLDAKTYPARAISQGKYLQPRYLSELQRLYSEISLSRPNVIVAAGNVAAWALLQATNIGSIRGTVATGNFIPAFAPDVATELAPKVLPTYHPAGVMRNWSWRPIVVADLMKAWREAQFPQIIRPERWVTINPTLGEIAQFEARLRIAPPPTLAVDIETAAGQISCIGFAPSPREALVIPFMNIRAEGGNYWLHRDDERAAWQFVHQILSSPVPKLFQNGMYDLQYILKMGIRPRNCLHDTMLKHHSLFPEVLKGLGFLGSIYTNEASWKLMNRPKADTEKKDE